MSKLDEHPTVIHARGNRRSPDPVCLNAPELRKICLEAGADDVGFVSIDRPEIADQRAEILEAFPSTQTLISIVCRMNRDDIRSPARSVANLEFHETSDHANHAAREIVRELEDRGIRALNPASGFPMEMDRFPGRIWVVSHKPVAVAAGLGQMGVHRNVIHPKFGNFIILATVLVAASVEEQSVPIDYNPCLTCKLCVAACPVGAIKPDGEFDFSACMTHNYREFMNGFTDWSETIAESRSAIDYRHKVNDQESASMWQSLAFGPNYKAAYCLAVCPAGEDVIQPFLDNRTEFVAETLRPLQQKAETIYVVPQSDAEAYVVRKFPHKKVKRVNGLRPSTIAGFIAALPLVFQPGQSKGLGAVYHFSFHGAETVDATVTIRNQLLGVQSGRVGEADCYVRADAATWLGFLRKEKSIVWAIICRRLKVRGPLSLLTRFGQCFPS
ncbi:MAG: SCP2 sterol-binding domain-containing protein [Planctomycetaceae bacterium]